MFVFYRKCVNIEALRLTSNIFKVDGLSVGVEQLDNGVIVVLHSAADGGHISLDHCHIVSRQVLAFNFTTQRKKVQVEEVMFWMGELIFAGYQTLLFLMTGTACKH